jgi:mono/diheme cytochrome c family protein
MTGSAFLAVAALPLLIGIASTGAGQSTRKEQPPLVLKSTVGADLYHFYCSNCHGETGKGGTARSALHPPPPDLTILARQNGGVFPRDRVFATIAFGKIAGGRVHGLPNMPIWGEIFRGLEPSDVMVEVRIQNLVQYIESIQEPTGEGGRE